LIVFRVWASPEPSDILIVFHGERTIMQADTDRTQSADFLVVSEGWFGLARKS
jgi:hypothetical protein